MTWVCLKGLMGTEDYGFLGEERIEVDLFDDNWMGKIQELKIKDMNLIGYSLAARVVMGLFLDNPHRFHQAYFLAGHPGLLSAGEKIMRKNWENEVLALLKSSSEKEFLTYWNSLSVFEEDSPMSNFSRIRFEKLFRLFPLSDMSYYAEDLLPYQNRLTWMVGEKDEKYKQIYIGLEHLGHRVRIVPNAGHRLLQTPLIGNYITKE